MLVYNKRLLVLFVVLDLGASVSKELDVSIFSIKNGGSML
jgi:hypothetical protein